jgi:hypothetical protein
LGEVEEEKRRQQRSIKFDPFQWRPRRKVNNLNNSKMSWIGLIKIN